MLVFLKEITCNSGNYSLRLNASAKRRIENMRKTFPKSLVRQITNERRDAFAVAAWTRLLNETVSLSPAPDQDFSHFLINRTIKESGDQSTLNFASFYAEFRDWVLIQDQPCLVRNPAFGIRAGSNVKQTLAEMLISAGTLHTSKAEYRLIK